MRLSLLAYLAISSTVSLVTYAAEEKHVVKIISGGEVEAFEGPCHFSFSKVMTSEEREKYKDQKCHGLKIKKAKIQTKEGKILDVESIELPGLMKRLSGNVMRESKECVDLYVDGMNELFKYQESSQKNLDFGKILRVQTPKTPHQKLDIKIPEYLDIVTFEDGKMVAEPSVKSFSLESDNKILGTIGDVAGKIANKGTELADIKQGFMANQIVDGKQVKECHSVALKDDVKIDDEKYTETLDGSVVNDSRKFLKNIWKKTVNGAGTVINNGAEVIGK